MLKEMFAIGIAAAIAPGVLASDCAAKSAGSCGGGKAQHQTVAAGYDSCGGEEAQHQTIAAGYEKSNDIVDTAVQAGDFTILAKALTEAGLVETLKGDGPFTVFAPTDAAFNKLPEGTLETLLRPENREMLVSILTYHVVPGNVMAKDVVKLNNATTVNGQRVDIVVDGGQVMVDNATVVKTDIRTSNGVIHVIDSVILPTTDTIPSVARSADQFTTLLAAVEAAGLDKTLMGEGPFTVFAPTDEAFAKLPAGTVESLLKPENRDQLVEILTYHVVPGRVYSDQVVKLDSAKTVEGSKVRISKKYGKVRIDDATLLAADIEASNGVIHVIDSVIMPSH